MYIRSHQTPVPTLHCTERSYPHPVTDPAVRGLVEPTLPPSPHHQVEAHTLKDKAQLEIG